MPASQDHVDVVIVGSGPTGSAYARSIADALPSASILMVEAGPVATRPPADHMANIADREERARAQIAYQGPQQRRYPRPTHEEVARADDEVLDRALLERPGLFRIGTGDLHGDGFPAAQASSGVGGMGSHWFGACPRPDGTERIDLIDGARLDDAYDRAEALLRVHNDQFTNRRMAERMRAIIGGVVDDGRAPHRVVQQMPMALIQVAGGVVRSGPSVLLGPLLDDADSRFELRAETLARRILMAGPRATGVELVDRKTGESSIVEASHVVVAGDSIRTPQLLFASGIRPPALGRHLNEHPQVSLMAVMEDGRGAPAADAESGDTGVMSDPSAMAIASSGVTWIPFDGDRFPFHAQISHVDPASLGLTGEEIARLGPVIAMSLFLPQEIDARNRVFFSESETDYLGMPAIGFHYQHSARDREVIDRAKRTLETLASALGSPLRGERPRVLPSGSSLHYQGTVRMGLEDDGTSVCDTDSRVWGTDNVFVAGNGVIPTSTACNPTLTSVALAILGAECITAELGGTRRLNSVVGSGNTLPG